MKNLFLGVCILLCLPLVAQDDAPATVMFESIILEPDYENIAELAEALENHNKTYHKAGTPYEAYVYNISTGPNVGKIVWMMGPHSWSDLDSRPSGDGHDEDWMGNVVPNLEGMEHGEYWKRDNELSLPPNEGQYPILYVRYHNFSKTEGYRGDRLLKQISATMKAMDEVKSWAVYDNQMRQGYRTGRHLAMVSGMNSWAEMEEDWPFMETFEEIHGKGSFNTFVKEMEAVTTDSWDEIWTYNAKLSGKEE